MEGVTPSTIVTCSLAGEPNTTNISQVYYVDESHVALSHQFFNKTYKSASRLCWNPTTISSA